VSSILASASLGRLGCSRDNQPYVVPIYFGYEPDFIYVLSTFGQKTEWMRANPKVCLEVDEIANQSQWMSVIAIGRYQNCPSPNIPPSGNTRDAVRKALLVWQNALGERQLRLGDHAIAPLFSAFKLIRSPAFAPSAGRRFRQSAGQ